MADRSVVYKIQAEVSDARAKIKSFAGDVQDAGKKMTAASKDGAQLRQSMDQIGSSAGKMGALAAIGIGAAIKKAADFDAAMSDVRAATQETEANMQRLRQAAMDAGADTAFSATEAAAGIEELSKAGVSTADILGGGLSGALDLAAAGNLEVGAAAEIAATALTQFELKGSDVSHVADLLAAGAGKAQGEVTDLGGALSQSGLVASQMGVSLEETVGTLSAFASAGLLGSDAGTSFKTMLQRLANPSKEATATMESLGIAAYDANGELVSMSELAGQLQTAFEGKTQAERDAAMATMFGSDAIRAANVLYMQGSKGISDWTKNVDQAGYAADTAKTRLDNLKGDLETLGGALESALIGTGDGAQGPLRTMVGVLTDLVEAYNELPGPVKTALGATTAFAAAGGGAVWTFTKAVDVFSSTREALSNLDAAFTSTSTSSGRAGGAIGKVGRAAGVATAALVAMEIASQFAPEATVASMEEIEAAILGVKKAADGKSLDEVFTVSGSSMTSVDGLKDALETLNWNGFEKGLDWLGSLGGIFDSEFGLAKDSVAAFDQTLAQMVNAGHLEDAAVGAKEFHEAAAEAGLSSEETSKYLSDYEAALTGVDNENQRATSSTQAHTSALQEQAEAFAKSREEALRAADAELNWYAALDDTTDALEKNGRTVDITTEKGRANRSALYEMAAAWQALDPASREAAGGAKAAKDAFMDAATSMGMGRAEARELYAELMKIPKNVSTDVNVAVNGITSAEYQLANLVRTRTVDVGIRVNAGAAGGGTQLKGSADGGTVPTTGLGYADRHPYLLADGEEVISNRYGQADKHRALLKAINENRLADGGTVAYSSSRTVKSGGSDAALRRLEKAQVRLSDSLDKFRDKLDKIREKQEEAGSNATSHFGLDLWAKPDAPGNPWAATSMSTSANPMGNLAANIAGLEERQGLMRRLKKAGLDKDAFSVAMTGSNADLEAMLAGGKAGVQAFEARYNRYASLERSVSAKAGDYAYGAQEAKAVAEVRGVKSELRLLRQEIKAIDRAKAKREKSNADRTAAGVSRGVSKAASRGATRRR